MGLGFGVWGLGCSDNNRPTIRQRLCRANGFRSQATGCDNIGSALLQDELVSPAAWCGRARAARRSPCIQFGRKLLGVGGDLLLRPRFCTRDRRITALDNVPEPVPFGAFGRRHFCHLGDPIIFGRCVSFCCGFSHFQMLHRSLNMNAISLSCWARDVSSMRSNLYAVRAIVWSIHCDDRCRELAFRRVLTLR